MISHRTSSPLAPRFIGALASLGATGLLLSACVAAPADDGEVARETESTQYLFGFSREQILQVKDPVAHPMTEEQWLQMNEGPFECARFGDLCRITGRDAAYDILETSYEQRLEGATIAEIDAYLAKAIDAAAAVWEEPEGEGQYRDHITGYVDNGSSDKRVRIRAYDVYPLGGTAYSKGDCTYQEKGFLGIWSAESATHTAKVRSHVLSTWSYGGTYHVYYTDYEPNPSNHSEYLSTTDTAETVEVGRLYHTAGYPWGTTWGGNYEADTTANIIPRACCNSTKGSWSTGGTWCIGDG